MVDNDYIKRRDDWFKNHLPGVRPIEEWDEGEEISMYNKKNIESGHLDGSEFPDFVKQASDHFGERVEIDDKTEILEGISYTYFDYYYITRDLDNHKLHYHTCVSPIKFLE